MSKQFDLLVNEALAVEKELRRLTPDKPSLRCFISLCLARAGEDYSAVEEFKERMTDSVFALKSGCSAFVRDLAKQMGNSRISEPPEKRKVGSLFFNQKDAAVLELGGQPERLFILWVVAAEIAYQQTPAMFGTIEDLGKHRARLAELGAKRKDLHNKISSRTSWDNSDIIVGRITSDFAALISWRMAPDIAVGMGPETLVDELLEQAAGKKAKAA